LFFIVEENQVISLVFSFYLAFEFSEIFESTQISVPFYIFDFSTTTACEVF